MAVSEAETGVATPEAQLVVVQKQLQLAEAEL
jgi:hypothetical protein